MGKVIECLLDRKAWAKSWFTNKPVGRKYDEWYYVKGDLISAWELTKNK